MNSQKSCKLLPLLSGLLPVAAAFAVELQRNAIF